MPTFAPVCWSDTSWGKLQARRFQKKMLHSEIKCLLRTSERFKMFRYIFFRFCVLFLCHPRWLTLIICLIIKHLCSPSEIFIKSKQALLLEEGSFSVAATIFCEIKRTQGLKCWKILQWVSQLTLPQTMELKFFAPHKTTMAKSRQWHPSSVRSWSVTTYVGGSTMIPQKGQ